MSDLHRDIADQPFSWRNARWRTWMRGHTPDFLYYRLGLVVPKARDCRRHHWYNIGNGIDGCYHCEVTRSTPHDAPWFVGQEFAASSGGQLDLDAAAAEIDKRRGAWARSGWTVGQLTWRDQAAGWPYPLVSREDAQAPDSVGVVCRRGPIEFSVVLFDGAHSPDPGGWADVDVANVDTGQLEMTAPNVADIAEFARLLDATFSRGDQIADPGDIPEH